MLSKNWKGTSMPKLSCAISSLSETSEKRYLSFPQLSTQMDDFELASISQVLQQDDLLLVFQISEQAPTYRTSRINSEVSSSPTPDTSSAISTSNKVTAGPLERFTGISSVILVILMLANLVTCILLLLGAVFPNWTGLEISVMIAL